MQRVTFEGETLSEINALTSQFVAGANDSVVVKIGLTAEKPTASPTAAAAKTLVETCDQEAAAKELVDKCTETQAPPTDDTPDDEQTTVVLDEAGLPWDGRIHAGSKALLANGNWRYLRNVDKALVVTVEAELLDVMSAPAASTETPAPPTETPAPPATKTPAPPTSETPAPPTDDIAVPQDFAQLMEIVGKALLPPASVTSEQLDGWAAELELPAYVMLSNRQDLVPAFGAKLLAHLNA